MFRVQRVPNPTAIRRGAALAWGAWVLGSGCVEAPPPPIVALEPPDASIREAAPPIVEASTDPRDAAPLPEAGPSVPDAAAPEPVRISIGLNASRIDDAVLADLEVVALGSRVTTVTHRWSAESGIEGAIERARFFIDEGVEVLFSIDLVRALRPLLPTLSTESLGAVQQSLDTLFASGLPLSGVMFGEALDVALLALPAPQREAFAELISASVAYASNHGARGAIPIGIHTTAHVWADPPGELPLWADSADWVALSWFGIDAEGRAVNSLTVGTQLEQLLGYHQGHGKPVILREVSYPSSESVNGTSVRQARFFGALFDELSRQSGPVLVPYVAVTALDSPPEAVCQAYAQDYGLVSNAATARCSLGLRSSMGVPLEAYYAVVEAMASTPER